MLFPILKKSITSKKEMSEIVVREVTEKDYEDVINIRRKEDVYHGLDYLPDLFILIYNTPGYKGYAAVVDGKIVAFEFAGVLDDGQTLFGRAGRVSKQYSGKGVMEAINDYLLKTYTRNPKLKYSVATFDNERYTNKIKDQVKDGFKQLVHEKAIYAYKSSIRSINRLLMSMDIPDYVKAVTREDMARIFDTVHICRHLFPRDRLVVNWVAYQPVKSNIRFIYGERYYVYGSNIDDVGDNHAKPLLTFSSYCSLHSVILYTIDVYGSHTDALPGHLNAHLKRFQKLKLPHDTLQLEFYCYDNVSREHCDTAAQQFGFKSFDLFRKRQYCTLEITEEESRLKSNL